MQPPVASLQYSANYGGRARFQAPDVSVADTALVAAGRVEPVLYPLWLMPVGEVLKLHAAAQRGGAGAQPLAPAFAVLAEGDDIDFEDLCRLDAQDLAVIQVPVEFKDRQRSAEELRHHVLAELLAIEKACSASRYDGQPQPGYEGGIPQAAPLDAASAAELTAEINAAFEHADEAR